MRMKGLFGDFGTMPLKDVVVYLGNKKGTGTLVLERNAVRKQVVVSAGEVVNASSNEPREYLGQFLINLGHISEDQFQKAYETQRESKIFLGQILVMIGAVSEDTLKGVLALKVRETVLEPFMWAEGTFAWEEGKLPPSMQGVDVRVSLSELHREGSVRDAVWRTVRKEFPSGDNRLLLDRNNLAEPPRAGSLDEKLFGLIEAGNTIDEIILALHATDFFIYQRLFAMHRLGAVQCADKAPPPAMSPPLVPTDGNLVSAARDLIRRGLLREAMAAARAAVSEEQTNETRALLQEGEAAWLAALRKELMASPMVPRLTATAAEIKAMPLTAPERYLLSRVDGKRILGAIISVAPLRELDALAHFQRFVQQGVVTIERAASN
jgi:Domain of unknown function (DUF4388)